jgi:hypothetical protein
MNSSETSFMVLELGGNDPSFWFTSVKVTVLVIVTFVALAFLLRQFTKLRLVAFATIILIVGLYTPGYVRHAIERQHSDPVNGYRSCAHFLVIQRRMPFYSALLTTSIILLVNRRSSSRNDLQ